MTGLVEHPPQSLVEALTVFAGNGGNREDAPVATFRFGQTTLIVFRVSAGVDLEAALSGVSGSTIDALLDPNAFSVLLVPVGMSIDRRRVLGRGLAALSLHEAIAEVIGLPTGWRQAQSELAERSLGNLFVGDELRTATLYGVWGQQRTPIVTGLSETLLDWTSAPGRLVYLKAEAGKGKSTAFAEIVWRHQGTSDGPLPLLLPLRSVPRGGGVSWAAMAASIGIVGQQADTVSRAAQCGLVCLLLDGLDEVSGRYDPNVVAELLAEVQAAVGGTASRVAISGRTTEALAVRATAASENGPLEISLELPDTDDPEFVRYVESVVDAVVPTWPAVAPRVPEPPLDRPTLPSGHLSTQERANIIEWILRTFDELGKERSLFFAQSLACIARTYQLSGNRPLVIRSGHVAKTTAASVFEVCVLAAALASIREQDKIEDLAKGIFEPAQQLELLTWLALKASVEDSLRDELPTTNELARAVFGIDPVSQNEEFTATLRQMQKHALLFAALGPSTHAGDWRPQFLSEWVRSALLCRAWLNKTALAVHAPSAPILRGLCRSQKASLAFSVILPELVRTERMSDWRALAEGLRQEADLQSPEAAANFWHLFSGLLAMEEGGLSVPASIPPMTDLTALSMSGGELPQAFGGVLVVLIESEFDGTSIRGSLFEQCDFGGATFRGCVLDGVTFDSCDGPMTFDGCVLRNCVIRNTRGRSAVLLKFTDCKFEEGTRIVQDDSPATGGRAYGPVAIFVECSSEKSPAELLSGDWLGIDPDRVAGIREISAETEDQAELCVRAMLKPFFPVRAGTDGQRQARGYIRSSALGRGAMPTGSPSDGDLLSALEALGFSSGGRQAHVYAPWSSVGGASTEGVELRNELLAFLVSGSRGSRVAALIERVRQAGNWPRH